MNAHREEEWKMPQNSGEGMCIFQVEGEKLSWGKMNLSSLVIFIYTRTRTCISVPQLYLQFCRLVKDSLASEDTKRSLTTQELLYAASSVNTTCCRTPGVGEHTHRSHFCSWNSAQGCFSALIYLCNHFLHIQMDRRVRGNSLLSFFPSPLWL